MEAGNGGTGGGPSAELGERVPVHGGAVDLSPQRHHDGAKEEERHEVSFLPSRRRSRTFHEFAESASLVRQRDSQLLAVINILRKRVNPSLVFRNPWRMCFSNCTCAFFATSSWPRRPTTWNLKRSGGREGGVVDFPTSPSGAAREAGRPLRSGVDAGQAGLPVRPRRLCPVLSSPSSLRSRLRRRRCFSSLPTNKAFLYDLEQFIERRDSVEVAFEHSVNRVRQ